MEKPTEKKSVIVYESGNDLRLEVKTDGETIWLTQSQICQLLGRDQSVVARHIGNIFKEGELEKKSVYAKYAYTASDGKTYQVAYYNLDVVISVGYRVKSIQGTRFRQWATRVLREMLLNRLEELKRISSLENRMSLVETDVEQIKEGVDYLAQQLESDGDEPHPRIGFGAKKGEMVDKPYGRRGMSGCRI